MVLACWHIWKKEFFCFESHKNSLCSENYCVSEGAMDDSGTPMGFWLPVVGLWLGCKQFGYVSNMGFTTSVCEVTFSIRIQRQRWRGRWRGLDEIVVYGCNWDHLYLLGFWLLFVILIHINRLICMFRYWYVDMYVSLWSF